MKTLGFALLGTMFVALHAGVLAGPAHAHQFWLAPSDYAAAVRQPVSVAALAGTGFRGKRKPWSPSHGVRLVARAARTVDLTRAAIPGGVTWIRFAPTDDGGAMLAFESTFTPIQLAPDLFDAYLEEEGLTAARNARLRAGDRTAGRERYRRCAKSWLSGHDPARATSPIGLPLEIVPGAIPGAGPALPITILREGRPLAGALVKAWISKLGSGALPSDPTSRDSLGFVWEARTDARGHVSVPVTQAGEWLLSVVDMVPCREKSVADWESTWGSLTFASGVQ